MKLRQSELTCIHVILLQIRETPHRSNHKFVEFYDVRAAEAALRALNRSDIAGKQIKVEPSRPGGARRYASVSLTTLTVILYPCTFSSVAWGLD